MSEMFRILLILWLIARDDPVLVRAVRYLPLVMILAIVWSCIFEVPS